MSIEQWAMSIDHWALSIDHWALSIEHWSYQEHSQVACSVLPVPPASYSHLPGKISLEITHAGIFWNFVLSTICVASRCLFIATVLHRLTLSCILLPPAGTNISGNYTCRLILKLPFFVKNLCCLTLSCFATVSHLFTLFFILLPPGGTNTGNYMQVNLKIPNRIICQTNRLIEREISWTQGRLFLATLALHFGPVSHSVGHSFKLA